MTEQPPDQKTFDFSENSKWLFERRLDYAQAFFDHHAKQRMSMFNFFLIFVAFVVSGYATLLKGDDCRIATVLALIAATLTVVFIFLDRRNEELVHITEDVLESLESGVLFSGYKGEIWWPRRREWWGRMKTGKQRESRQLGIFLRQRYDQEDGMFEGKKLGRSRYEHGWWLPGFQCCIAIMFLLLAILPWVHGSMSFCQYALHLGPCK